MAGFTVYNDKIDLDELFGIDFDEVAEEALKEAAPILERSMKAAVQASIGHSGDSELVRSIKANKPRKSKNGAWIVNVAPKDIQKLKYIMQRKVVVHIP